MLGSEFKRDKIHGRIIEKTKFYFYAFTFT